MTKELVRVYGTVAVPLPASSLTSCISCLPFRYARQMAETCLLLATSWKLIWLSLLQFYYLSIKIKLFLEVFPICNFLIWLLFWDESVVAYVHVLYAVLFYTSLVLCLIKMDSVNKHCYMSSYMLNFCRIL